MNIHEDIKEKLSAIWRFLTMQWQCAKFSEEWILVSLLEIIRVSITYRLIFHNFWTIGWTLLIDISFYSYWGEKLNGENLMSQFLVVEEINFGNFVSVLLKSGVIKITQAFNFCFKRLTLLSFKSENYVCAKVRIRRNVNYLKLNLKPTTKSSEASSKRERRAKRGAVRSEATSER